MSWLVPVVLIGLTAAGLLDLWRTPRLLVPGPPVLVWTALLIALPGLGATAWFLLRHLAGEPPRDERPRGPLGPDDDPAFLRSIEPHHGEGA